MENDSLGDIIDRGLSRQPRSINKYGVTVPGKFKPELRRPNEKRQQEALARWKERLNEDENSNNVR